MGRIRFALALHNHQPVGNFDGVIEAAYHDSYRPFLDVIENYPEIPFCLHTSGCLMEWLVDRKPEYIDRLRRLVERGQVEILGGGFYEPILPMIPPRDRRGQIRGYSEYLSDLLGANIRGMWIPERVWEQSLVPDITQSGIEYSILDDFHFRKAGLSPEKLHGYYTTEDQGEVLRLFPGSEPMRYLIPFREVHEFLGYLGHVHHHHPDAIVVFADDGEKFGTWPDTKSHVYERGWIYRFLDALRDNRHWIETCTLSQAIDAVPPVGSIYLPDASYREMTEWALPPERLVEYERHWHDLDHHEQGVSIKEFFKGGNWRNFKTKYPETREMYGRMMEISSRIESLIREDRPAFGDYRVQQAQQELYRGQCNCSYWHGAFGGLYLPHLRGAIFGHLIKADNLLDQYERGDEARYAHVEVRDFDFDARPEVKLSSDKLACYFAPHRGGHLEEFDVRSVAINLGSSLARRPEAYHHKIKNAQHHHDGSETKSIHDRIVFKQEGLDQHLNYDLYPRKTLVDRFLPLGTTLEQCESLSAEELGDFIHGKYDFRAREEGGKAGVELTRHGHVEGRPLRISKSVSIIADDETIHIHYELSDLPIDRPLLFAIEWNIAALATGADDRYFVNTEGERLARLGDTLDISSVEWIGLVDEWIGIEVGLGASHPTGMWIYPVRTVSQSEAGFELVHQSICLVTHWEIPAGTMSWSVDLSLTADCARHRSRLQMPENQAAITSFQHR